MNGLILTATLSGCSNPITKYVTLGTPNSSISDSLSCPNVTARVANIPGASFYEWHLVDTTAHTQSFTDTSSNIFSANIGNGHIYNLGVTYTTACGVSAPAVVDGLVCSGGAGPFLRRVIAASPNPTPGQVAVSLLTAPVLQPEVTGSTMNVAAMNVQPVNTDPGNAKIYAIRVYDKMGSLKKIFTYAGGVTNVTVDLGSLPADVYTIQVYDNTTWTAKQLILKK